MAADPELNYDHFLNRVRSTRVVWGLQHPDGWAICPSVEQDCDLYVFWSDEADAQRHCTEEWASYKPAAIALDVFLQHWLPGMEKDGLLVGVQFDADMTGLEVEPSELASDLRARRS